MTILDRMYFVNFVRNYLIVLVCLLGLYIVVDLFTNLNDFTGQRGGIGAVAKHIAAYYAVQVTLIFDKLSEPISVIAAAFTVFGMQRGNEILPLLSAGVPTLRVIRPVLLGCILSLAIAPLNTEFLIPLVADSLSVPRDDPDLLKPTKVRGAFDSITKEHYVGEDAFRRDLKVSRFEYTSPADTSSGLVHLTAAEAFYIPEASGKLSRGWQLFNASPESLPDPLPDGVVRIGPGQYFLKTREVDFETITRRPTWYHFAPTHKLWELLNKPEGGRQQTVAVLFHFRLTRPLIGCLMVLLALAIFLHDQTRHILVSVGICLVAVTIFYAVLYGSKYLGEHDVLPPTLAAWLPVMIFGPIIFGMFDAVHT